MPSGDTPEIRKKRQDEIRIVTQMIRLYCHGQHRGAVRDAGGLCSKCRALSDYAAKRTAVCPFMETKTFCSACSVHCYAPEMKERIREVMRYAGPRMLLHHPAATIRHAVVTLRNKHRSTLHSGEKVN